MKKINLLILLLFLLPSLAFGFSKDGITYTTDGSMADVNAAISDSTAGDIVNIPADSFTWGASGTYITVNKAIILQGAGQGQTIITLSDSGPTYGNGTIRISAAATVKSMTINGANNYNVTALSASTTNGWRVTDIAWNGGSISQGYFIYAGTYGLIDNNTIYVPYAQCETIFVRGPANSWQTTNSIGGADNVFIENNTFSGSGYVCDANSNARVVVRYNTINGTNKIDGHGLASNYSPSRGVRHMEIYNNLFTNTGAYWKAIHVRGGTARIFDNVVDNGGATNYINLALTEYGSYIAQSNFGGVCQCVADRPVLDSIGRGYITSEQDSEPMYIWGNTCNGSAWSVIMGENTNACVATCGAFNMSDMVVAGEDYFISEAKPEAMSGYTPYTYPHPLRISSVSIDSFTGLGTGLVASDDTISCTNGPSGTCNEDVAGGTVRTLSATPDAGSVFLGWGYAGCEGTGDCVLTGGIDTNGSISINPIFGLLGANNSKSSMQGIAGGANMIGGNVGFAAIN